MDFDSSTQKLVFVYFNSRHLHEITMVDNFLEKNLDKVPKNDCLTLREGQVTIMII